MRSNVVALAFLLGAGPVAGLAVHLGASGAWACAGTTGLATLLIARASRNAPGLEAAARGGAVFVSTPSESWIPDLVASVLSGVGAFALAWAGPAILLPAWPVLAEGVRSPLFAGTITAVASGLSALDLRRDREARPSSAA